MLQLESCTAFVCLGRIAKPAVLCPGAQGHTRKASPRRLSQAYPPGWTPRCAPVGMVSDMRGHNDSRVRPPLQRGAAVNTCLPTSYRDRHRSEEGAAASSGWRWPGVKFGTKTMPEKRHVSPRRRASSWWLEAMWRKESHDTPARTPCCPVRGARAKRCAGVCWAARLGPDCKSGAGSCAVTPSPLVNCHLFRVHSYVSPCHNCNCPVSTQESTKHARGEVRSAALLAFPWRRSLLGVAAAFFFARNS